LAIQLAEQAKEFVLAKLQKLGYTFAEHDELPQDSGENL
jgi:hypothetical protein